LQNFCFGGNLRGGGGARGRGGGIGNRGGLGARDWWAHHPAFFGAPCRPLGPTRPHNPPPWVDFPTRFFGGGKGGTHRGQPRVGGEPRGPPNGTKPDPGHVVVFFSAARIWGVGGGLNGPGVFDLSPQSARFFFFRRAPENGTNSPRPDLGLGQKGREKRKEKKRHTTEKKKPKTKKAEKRGGEEGKKEKRVRGQEVLWGGAKTRGESGKKRKGAGQGWGFLAPSSRPRRGGGKGPPADRATIFWIFFWGGGGGETGPRGLWEA